MIDMRGHKVEVKGIHKPTPEQVQMLKEDGIDLSDIGTINEFTGPNNQLTVDEIWMVVWGEDLGRIPLVVFGEGGRVLFEMKDPQGIIPDSAFDKFRQAAVLINEAVEIEQTEGNRHFNVKH